MILPLPEIKASKLLFMYCLGAHQSCLLSQDVLGILVFPYGSQLNLSVLVCGGVFQGMMVRGVCEYAHKNSMPHSQPLMLNK